MAIRRSWRTVFLALLASAVFAWSAIYHFDVAPAVMLDILWMSLSVVAIAMLCAALAVAIKLLFRSRD
jgi:hypothetical protein